MDPCEILATELVSAGFGLGGAPWGIRLRAGFCHLKAIRIAFCLMFRAAGHPYLRG